MLKYVTELVGTFVFLLIILKSGDHPAIQPLVIATGLLAAIFMGGKLSGGHFNPAVSIMKHVAGGDAHVGTVTDLASYVGAQVLGGLMAYQVHEQMKKEG